MSELEDIRRMPLHELELKMDSVFEENEKEDYACFCHAGDKKRAKFEILLQEWLKR